MSSAMQTEYLLHQVTANSSDRRRIKDKPRIQQFKIRFTVTKEMVPSCRILVYYIRDDGEIVADGLFYDVEDLLENKVRTYS